MKKLFFSSIFIFVLTVLSGIFYTGCKDEEESPDPVNLAVITTQAVQDIKSNGALGGGNITDDGGAAVTARGLVWAGYESPTTTNNEGMSSDGTGEGSFSGELINLMPYTTYYVRAYATNIKGTAYGNQLTFETLPEGAYSTVTDADGNTYWTVKIGETEWMAENLRSTKFADGTAIPTGLSDEEWSTTDQPAYRVYPKGDTIAATKDFEPVLEWDDYGYLYNAYAAFHPHICPDGWFVPTEEEWNTSLQALALVLNEPLNLIGDALKSCRQVNSPLGGGCNTNWHPRWDEHWFSYGTNKAFFLALPVGKVNISGEFTDIGKEINWWTSTWTNTGWTPHKRLRYNFSDVLGGQSANNCGYSIRCYRPMVSK